MKTLVAVLIALAGCELNPIMKQGNRGGVCFTDRSCSPGLACMTFHMAKTSDDTFLDIERCVADGDVKFSRTFDGGQ